ncbi:cytochrome c-type biogenesis protein CcmH [Aliiroseovarius sp. YM-037]|uniref:cytochrome c-type biogenesis protein n=1 Tax=Aliiroseovarius sp. YM-037 TaxID=3341728 RepID=UPI003A7FA64E
MKRLLFILMFVATPLLAVEPSEMLDDPALEARAQALDEEIRCVQCQSENIASSNADWAKDARLMVRELVAGGATDREVTSFFVERYGERVLMTPRGTGTNLVLWLAGPFMLFLALIGVALALRRKRVDTAPLSDADEARLREILDD